MGLKGYRLWAMGQLDSTCRAPPYSPMVALGNASSAEQKPPMSEKVEHVRQVLRALQEKSLPSAAQLPQV
jgi:hypothetical protein